MENDRIDSYINRANFKQETDDSVIDVNRLYKAFQNLESIIQSVTKSTNLSTDIKIKTEGIQEVSKMEKLLTDLHDTLSKLAAKEKELADVQVKLTETQKKLNDEQARSGAAGAAAGEQAKKNADNFNKFGASITDNIQKQIELKSRLTEIAAELKKLHEFDTAAKGSKQFTDEVVKLTEEQAHLQNQLQDTNKVIKSQVKELQSGTDSVNEARAENAKLLQERNNVNASTAEGKKRIDELNASIDKNNDFIRENSSTLEKQKINIGNYAGSLAGAFDKVIGEIQKLKTRNEELKSSFQNLSGGRVSIEGFKAGNQTGIDPKTTAQLKSFTEEIQRNDTALAHLKVTQVEGFKVTQNQTQQVRNLENAYIELATSGTASNEFLNEFKNAVGAVKDDVRDLRESIKLAASDTRSLDVLIGTAQAIAGGFAVAQGAAALFGDENEDLQKTLVKLNGVMAILNGLQSIQNELKKKDNILTIIQTNLQKVYATVVGNSTGAMKAFRIALATTGILGVIILIGYLINKFNDLKTATNDSARNQQALLDVNKKAVETYAEEVTHLKLLAAEHNNASTSLKRKKEIQDELQKTYPSYFANLDKQADKEAFVAEQVDKVTKALIIQAKVQAAQSLLADKFQDLLKKQFDPTEAVDNIDVITSSLKNIFKSPADVGIDLAHTAEKNTAKAKVEYDKFEKFIIGFVTDSNKELATLGGDPHKEKKQAKALEDFAKDLAKVQADITKANFEALKQRRQDEITALETITNDAKRGYHERYEASQQFYDRSRELIDLNVAYEISAAKKATDEEIRQTQLKLKSPNLTVKQRADLNATLKALDEKQLSEEQAIRAKYATISISLDNNSEKQRTDIRQSAADRRKKILEDEEKFREEHNKSGHELNLQQIQNDFDTASELLDKRFANGLISEKKYNSAKLRLQADLQIATLQQEISYTEDIINEQKIRFQADEAELQHKIDIAKAEAAIQTDPAKKQDQLDAIKDAERIITQTKLSNNDIIAASEAKLGSLQIKIGTAVLDFFKKRNKETQDDFKETFERIANIAKEAAGILSDFAAIAATKEKNAIQDQIDKLEEKKQKDIEVINASIQNEQAKAAAISIIEARANAQREQLEIKKRQAQERQARYEKAANIASIILNTASAIVKALPNIALAITTGILGAAQLAIAIKTPISKFRTGKNVDKMNRRSMDNYEGPGIVDDGVKKEAIIRENGNVEIAKGSLKPRLTYLNKNDIVLPDADMLINMAFRGQERQIANASTIIAPVFETSDITDGLSRMEQNIVKAIRNKKEFHLSANESGMTALWKHSAGSVKYINEQTNW